ncbi:thioredoxin TrxC [Legionella sp. MW5194]|uniref:thioredoxin TrxC n=1 Tax=Legionella sp. MW5194 TaxID=2662448 RepID=UPI00193D39CD|nr:thioredoxin TrxC [Legionella sp. MW5194]QRN04623.1 thioredoxin TrxC [Legionella sp. MW5194]
MTDSMHLVCPHCQTINRLPTSRLTAHPKCGKCDKAIFDAKPASLDQMAFERHLKRSDIPLLVDFWAQWCGPCKIMAPHFESAAGFLEPDVRLVKINTETQPALAARYSIQSIPTLMLFNHGQEIARSAGVMGAQDIVRWVNQHLPLRH